MTNEMVNNIEALAEELEDSGQGEAVVVSDFLRGLVNDEEMGHIEGFSQQADQEFMELLAASMDELIAVAQRVRDYANGFKYVEVSK